MATLKTRQQRRAEKRRAQRQRDIFQTGLEALEIPISVLPLNFTKLSGRKPPALVGG